MHALVDAGERVVVCSTTSPPASPPPCPRGCCRSSAASADQTLVAELIEDHDVEAIIHFAGSTIVPDSIKDPLGYYGNNTANSRALIEAAVRGGVPAFHLFLDRGGVRQSGPRAGRRGRSDRAAVALWLVEADDRGDAADASAAHALSHVALRYFNVAGADPHLRTGLSTPGATHLIKVAVEAALGRRARIDVYGTDYPTPDGTCIRDFIHVSDLARAHLAALNYLRAGNASATLNCGYGRGYSIREVLNAVRHAIGHDFPVRFAGRRPGDIVVSVAAATPHP